MPTSKWKKIDVHQTFPIWNNPQNFVRYLDLLKNSIFPAIDELVSEGLIENYHFLNYSGQPDRLELRLLVSDENNLEKIKNILRRNNLPEDFSVYNENNNESQETLIALKLLTELIRVSVNQTKFPDILKFYSETIHYPNNALGMNRHDEITFHLNEAIRWLADLYIMNGFTNDEAFKKAKEKIIESLSA